MHGELGETHSAPEPGWIRKAIPPAAYRKGLSGPIALFLGCAALYAGAWLAIFRVPPFWRIPVGLADGLFLGMLFVIGHDACHGSFVAPRWLNSLIGRIAFLPSLHPFSYWEHVHNRLHHGWTNLKERDHVWSPFSPEEFEALPAWRRLVERVGRTFLGVALHYAVVIWWPRFAFPGAVERRAVRRWVGALDRLSLLAFLGAQIAIGSAIAGDGRAGSEIGRLASAVFFGVLVPFSTFTWLIGLVTFVHHNHERVRWYDRREEWSFAQGALRGTVHVVPPRAIDLTLLHIMSHTAHHIDVRIPLYRLPAAQAALEAVHGSDIVRIPFTLEDTLATFRSCKLYDYRAHAWLDFAGKATTRQGVRLGVPPTTGRLRAPLPDRGGRRAPQTLDSEP